MLIAATGLAGAGKTTSLKFLAAIGMGVQFYVGGVVQAEMTNRGLEATPENERIVRDSLRTAEGMAALAKRAAPDISDLLTGGNCVLIDAICNVEEARFYRDNFAEKLRILAIDTSFDTRAARLGVRNPRPMTLEQLRLRDQYECEALAIGSVIAGADVMVSNEGTELALHASLRALKTVFVNQGAA